MLRFESGAIVDLSGKFRFIRLNSGWYVIGSGISILVDSELGAKELIDKLNGRRDENVYWRKKESFDRESTGFIHSQ